MRFLVIVLFSLGFIGPAFGQSMGDISDKIWLPNCPTGTSTECDQSSLFPDAIALPFFHSDSVAIGTIVEKNSHNQDFIQYSLDVDFYLKNYQQFDLLTATLVNSTEPPKFPDVLYYNSPVFNEGDLVFVYLKKNDGQYKVLPESFALDKHEARGPPPDIHLTKSPSERVFQQGEKILVSGEVRKLELVKAVKQAKQLEANLMIVDSNDRDKMVFSDLMKIESDGNYNYFLDTSKIPPGKFELEVNYGPSTSGKEITIEPNFKIWTTIKQHNFGISNEEIQCREHLVLVQKYDGSPACVKSETKLKLAERGWTRINQTTENLLVNHFSNLSEVVAFYEVYDDAEFLLKEDHISYFSGSDDDYFVRMNLYFDENYSINEMDFHCYFQRVHQYEFPPEDIATKIVRYDCKEHGNTVNPTPEEPETISEENHLDIASIEDKYIHLNPADTCATISLRHLTPDKLEEMKSRDKEVMFFEINEKDLKEMPVLDELIRATHYLQPPTNDYAHAEMGMRELVDYEFFIMEKSIEKYNDSQGDYFMKLDSDLEKHLADPAKQGFSNEFIAPQIIYNDKTYVIGHTVFWVSDEHEMQSLSVHLQDNINEDEKFITLTDKDMEKIPKLKQAIENIGTELESIVAFKGLPENPDWNEYREWFDQKKTEHFNLDETYVPGFVYKDEYYDLGFPIC